MDQEWEHFVLKRINSAEYERTEREELNYYGRRGWQLTAVLDEPADARNARVFYLKRPVVK
jgi:hypothetical protein